MVCALLFDVFGTVVDWRGGVIRDVTELARARGAEVDAPGAAAFADAWRAGYAPSMDLVRRGELPWTKLDDLHRRTLDRLLAESGLSGLSGLGGLGGLSGLSEDEQNWLNTCWHRLDPWPDSVPGLRRLKKKFVIAAFSNGNVSLLVDMARRAGLPWDFVFSAELFRRYKPDPQVYRGAVELLSVTPPEVMLVAAHNNDLLAAAGQGLATAFVGRPAERGPHQHRDQAPAGDYTYVAADFEDLAAKLGC